jgi:hypothetical protein
MIEGWSYCISRLKSITAVHPSTLLLRPQVADGAEQLLPMILGRVQTLLEIVALLQRPTETQ